MYRTVLWIYRASLQMYTALLRRGRALLRRGRALLRKYKVIISRNIGLIWQYIKLIFVECKAHKKSSHERVSFCNAVTNPCSTEGSLAEIKDSLAGPYIQAKEPYILAKQPYILAKESYILAKEPCILAKEPYNRHAYQPAVDRRRHSETSQRNLVRPKVLAQRQRALCWGCADCVQTHNAQKKCSKPLTHMNMALANLQKPPQHTYNLTLNPKP